MINLNNEKLMFVIKIINFNTKIFAKKLMIVIVFDQQYLYGNGFDKSKYNNTILDCYTNI